MKFRVLSLAALVSMTVGGANANDLIEAPVQDIERPAAVANDFGTYRVVPGVRAEGNARSGFDLQNAALAAQSQSLGRVETRDVVRTEGNLVFNEITNEYGVLTGFISVLSADGSSVRAIASEFGLDVEMSEDRIGLGILYAGSDTDLVELAEAIRESGLARTVEIDVQEHLNRPHY